MTLSNRAFGILLLIILLEGYVVLSTELLAIRLLIPFVGSGTDTVSIIIAAVLLPLSFGYFYGGQFKPYKTSQGRVIHVRDKLLRNIFISTAILVFGLSYFPLMVFFETLMAEGIVHRALLTAIYSALFLITPVFLLGQTIPLISHYFSKENLSRITGKILFFSTIGSFLGAILSTLIFMNTIGVHNTVIVNFILLGLLFMLLENRYARRLRLPLVILIALGISFNSSWMQRMMNIVEDNSYSTVQVYENPQNDMRVFSINRDNHSSLGKDGSKNSYAEYIEQNIIYSLPVNKQPAKILVIGAGGFTMGLDDPINEYHFIDIDKALKGVAEEHFLERKLGENKHFHAMDARAFIKQDKQQYDVIILDAFIGDLTVPPQLVTVEFFEQIKEKLAPDGILTMNLIIDPTFEDKFSRNVDNTFRSVFPFYTQHQINNNDIWSEFPLANVIYIYNNGVSKADEPSLYTDDLNRVHLDRSGRGGHY